MSKRKKKGKKAKIQSVGGLAFLITLVCLFLIGAGNAFILPSLWDGTALRNWCLFAAGLVMGAWISSFFIKGKVSVFIHEKKHFIVSNFVGNTSKGMVYNKNSGRFNYSFTPRTKKSNAIIALAPYFLPVFTVIALIFAVTVYFQTYRYGAVLVIVGLGYGVDCLLNFRDISRIQTDITGITGGYSMGLLFIFAMNFALFTILAAWISQGIFGLKVLLAGHWSIFIHLFSYYRGL